MSAIRQCPHGFHHPAGPHSCDGCWCEGERDREQYGWDHNTDPGWPTMGELHRASVEARMRPIQARLDEIVEALPWHSRTLGRLALPIARLIARRKP